jgi:hypothetical protein
VESFWWCCIVVVVFLLRGGADAFAWADLSLFINLSASWISLRTSSLNFASSFASLFPQSARQLHCSSWWFLSHLSRSAFACAAAYSARSSILKLSLARRCLSWISLAACQSNGTTRRGQRRLHHKIRMLLQTKMKRTISLFPMITTYRRTRVHRASRCIVIIIGTLGKVHAKLSIEIFDSFTFARSHHQQRSALIPGGKLASFIFIGLKSWSKQGTLMSAKGCWDEKGEKHWYFETIWRFGFIRRDDKINWWEEVGEREAGGRGNKNNAK